MQATIKNVYNSFVEIAKDAEWILEYPITHIQLLLRIDHQQAKLIYAIMINSGAISVLRQNVVLVNKNFNVSENSDMNY